MKKPIIMPISRSSFGIDNCKKPRSNKRMYKKNSFTRKNKAIKKINANNVVIDNFILFPNSLGQTRDGVELSPSYIIKHIKRKKTRNVHPVSITNDMFQNINNLYNTNSHIHSPRINIGGDHTMAIATIAHSLNNYDDLKVIYFDAHADINTLEESESKHYHGMPLSFVTGLDYDNKFGFIKNKLRFENLLYIGSRCLDKFEVDEIYKRNIKYLTPVDINNNYEESIRKIVDFVGSSPIHISFDVDAIDPEYIPSTGTPVKNGVELQAAINTLDVLRTKNLVSLDITELNMKLGTSTESKKSMKNTLTLFKAFLD
uniref:Arginase n=1 Tax=viral metagenome TaxID=1070528 RepID=A0A6C0E5H7_9ZZZZ